ncbi:MAG: hypothetical protein P4L53_01405 [Candidatus Obscuribacterales bacterium]|nr:hypothetical protein [Candidatus Obscuribacterales bacterium]
MTLSILLCGCGQVVQKPPVQEPAPTINTPAVPLEYELKNGTLELYAMPPCSIKFKQTGVVDYVKAIDVAWSGKMIFLKPVNDSRYATGPDAIIEWTLKDGSYSNWIFITHPKFRVTNSVHTHDGHLQIAKGDSHSAFTVTVDDAFADLGGARQVIVPMKFSWENGKFKPVSPGKHGSVPNDKLKAEGQLYKPLFGYFGEGVAPPELAEAVLRLCNEGDDADAKKLLHYAWPEGRSGEQSCWKTLKEALRAKLQDWNKIERDDEDAK